jgi:hypothetical protein
MVSLAQQHREQHATSHGTPAVAGTARTSGTLDNHHRAMLAKLQADVIRIRSIRSRERRNDVKGGLLGEYADYLSIVMNSGDTSTNTVLVQCCIWALDAGNYGLCLKLAEHAISNGMESPDKFTRTLPEILLEELASQVNHSDQPDHYTPYLLTLAELTVGQDVTDEIKAKFSKALGKAQYSHNPSAALQAYRHAAHYGAKVQTIIRKLEQGVIDHE